MIYDKAMHEARQYWRERLEAASFASHIALDHPRPIDGSPQVMSLELSLSPDVHAALRKLTGGNRFLSYAALVAGLQIACHRYTGDPRVTIFSARSDGAPADLLPIAATLHAGWSFKDALLATKDLLAAAYRNQQYPLSRMVLDLRDEHRPQHLFLAASMTGLTGAIPDRPCDVAVCFDTVDAETRATFRFDRRLYDPSTIRALFGTCSDVLARGIADMTTRLADLGSVDGGQPMNSDPGAAVHRRIEAHASRWPGRIAIVKADRVTTYQQLERDAARLADALAELRLDVRRPVVLVIDAGAELVASMLAVLKIGASFAPIKLLATGLSLPAIFDALRPQCIVCQRGQLADLEQLGGGVPPVEHVVTVAAAQDGGDGVSLEVARHRGTPRPESERGAEAAAGESPSIACVLVSGRSDAVSTSAVTHAELARVFAWLAERCGLDASDRCVLSPGLGACEQLHETLGLLGAGASVEILDASSLQDSARLIERLLAPDITLWDLPVPLMQNLMRALAPRARREHARGPRNIVLTGDKQCVRLADRLARYFPDARITGLYAHPALGLWSTAFSFGERDPASDGCATAHPLPGFQHVVANRAGEPVPLRGRGELRLRRLADSSAPGAPGEIAHELTTGLRARALDGGRIGWLRGDDRVFVKYGCAVELTELEAVLCDHEDIMAAEVIAASPEHGPDSLVAAFVLADPDRVSPEGARDFLVHRSVDLVPDRFVVLDELPLTAEGAIDRAALLAGVAATRDATSDPRGLELDHIHRQLRTTWLEILQLADVDDRASFFAQGGNSLRATLLIARIKDDFGVDLSVQKFFREPSIAAVARLIAAEARTAGQPPTSEFKVVPRDRYRMQRSELER